MSRYYRHLIEDGLLLDTYPNAAVAYSLRKLRDGYKKVFNLLTHSEDISQTVYSKSSIIVGSNVTITPDGLTTADKLIEDVIFNTHFLSQFHSPTVVGLDYNFSVYLKAAERIKVDFQLSTSGTARINLSTGVIETNTIPVAPTVTNVGNGWWRVSGTFIAASTITNPLYRIFLVNGSNLTGYLGDGVSGIYVWGFQLTQSSTVLPYEKTVYAPETGAAIRVRRNIDSTEEDFGFDSSGNLDTSTLLDFVGYNLWTYSEQIQQAVWVKTQTSVTADIVVAPDGLTTADVALEIGYGTHGISRGAAVVNGNDYSVYFYIKDEGRHHFQIRAAINLSTNNATQPIAKLDLLTETVTSNGFFRISPTITSVGSGWYKIEYGLVCNSTTTSTALVIEYSPDGTTTTYTGDVTKGMAIWGLQISQTSVVKFYQKTEALAGGSGFIRILYDQSGNGNNLNNATPSLQYRIVVNGNIYRNSDNGLPSIDVVSTGFYTFQGTSINTSNPFINFNVYKSEPGNMILFGNSSVGGRPIVNLHNGSAGSRNIVTRMNTSSSQDFNLPFETNGSFITSTTRDASNYAEVTVNNNIVGGSALGVSTSGGLSHLGRYNSSANSSTGEMQEMIIWKQNYVSLKSNISDKINEYYGNY